MNVDWNKIYASRGLYSGHGSRGASGDLKVNAITQVLLALDPRTVLDVGCGDLHVVRQVDFQGIDYTGLDRSKVLMDQLGEQVAPGKLIAGEFGTMHFG